jgi:hypothetical protein
MLLMMSVEFVSRHIARAMADGGGTLAAVPVTPASTAPQAADDTNVTTVETLRQRLSALQKTHAYLPL